MKAALIALTLITCQAENIPDHLPTVAMLSNADYERVARLHGLEESDAFAHLVARVVIMKESRADEKLLCHEFKHFTHGHYH